MTEDELKKLLGKGFIPENLPKPFNSVTFSAEYSAYLPLIDKSSVSIPYKYDVYKKKYATRQFTLLNPYNFVLLAKTLKDNWSDVKAALDSSGISLTGIKFGDEDDKKAIKQITKNQFQDTVFSKSSGMSVLLTTDIVEHYEATYTHSVAWAVHGKEEAKNKWKATREGNKAARAAAKLVWDGMTGNVVDKVLRDGDEQQTHGIPTGPETSRIISEVILSAIDSEFIKQLKDNRISFVGGRYVDDYELYFESEHDAEKALQILRDVLNRYRYKVSEPKTYVLSGPPIPVDEEWRRRLRQITPKPLLDAEDPYSVGDAELDFKSVKHFVKEAVALTREFENPRVIKQVLSYPLRKYKCPDDKWVLYEVYLLQLLANYPNTAKAVFDIIQNHGKGAGDNVAAVLNRMLSSKNTTVYDVIWLLYGCILFDITLTDISTQTAASLNDPLVWLMLLHLKQSNKVQLDVEKFKDAWNSFSLSDEGWLYKYEAVRQGWIDDTQNVINNEPFFAKLLEQGVSFYFVEQEEIELVEADWVNDYEDFEIDEDFEPDPDWLFDFNRGR
jgi:hypothetical protein